MSKSPNILVPAAGGAALMLGAAFGIANIGYGTDRIETLEASFAAERATATEQRARAENLAASLSDAQAASAEQLAAVKLEAEKQAAQAEKQIAALTSKLQTASGNSASSSAFSATVAATGKAVSAPAPDRGALGLGRDAFAEEIAAWDVDILPDGRGLPEGAGDVWTGEEVFAEACASCHGDFAEGRDAWPVLAGGFDTLADVDPVKTVGSYWPYLSTVWDYVHRSMPFGGAGTLSDDEVYAITAYILYSNDLVDDDFTLSRETFADVAMYNTDGFIVDDRPSVEYQIWSGEPCMESCKDGPAQITRRSTDVGVTPADDGSMAESPMEEQLALLGGTEWGKERVAGSVFMGAGGVMIEEEDHNGGAQMASVDASDATRDAPDTPDPALIAKGEIAFKKCASCHQVGDGAKNRSGPQLNGVVGRAIAVLDGFKYSGAFKAAHDEGRVWDEGSLAAFLADPRGYIQGTKMSFRGLSDAADVDAVIAYLRTFE